MSFFVPGRLIHTPEISPFLPSCHLGLPFWHSLGDRLGLPGGSLRIPVMPDGDSNLKPDTRSTFLPDAIPI